MGVIMIKCPHTGLPVATGTETDDLTFDMLPDSLGLAVCPRCGLKHSWCKREAWLELENAKPGRWRGALFKPTASPYRANVIRRARTIMPLLAFLGPLKCVYRVISLIDMNKEIRLRATPIKRF